VKFTEILPGNIWGAAHGGYTWAIYYECGLPDWTEVERKAFVGYSASYRHGDETNTTKIGLYPTLDDAIVACLNTWLKIR
jgi:hypothetical protein